jgi:hypothetical protein
MTVTPTLQDLQLALLAFDAYNRGENTQIFYNKKIIQSTGKPDPSAILNTSIGDATYIQNSDQLPGAVSSGFSAYRKRLERKRCPPCPQLPHP